ncbi:MAG: TlpA family protein disulfide reductase [Deltaproteobacteria bacterium]|nr:TlpA family protein disulfide reductase [Deltaproteobacteria bacterium]
MALRSRYSMATGRLITCCLFVLLPALAPSTAGGPPLTELVKTLNLSTYPSTTRPPEFRGQTREGKTVSLNGLRGKVVILNFWATWCRECLAEMPGFEQLHRKFSRQGLAVLGINAREGTAAVRKYSNELGLTFPLVLDPRGEINAAYGVIGLPTTFVIGRDGRAVALAVGPRDWASASARAIIEALLAEPAARKKEQ